MVRFRTQLKMLNGAPTVHVNDHPLFLNAPYLQKAPHATFSPAATGVYLIHDGPISVARNGTPSVEDCVQKVQALLDAEPDAFAMVRSFPPAPGWWLDENPDDVMQFDCDVTRYDGYDNFRDSSWGSAAWLAAAAGWYEEWCRALHQRFGGRIIGYQFGMGSCGENNPIGACTHDGRWFCHDFSPAMHRYFHSWLRAAYKTDDALRDAWSDDSVSLDTAEIPGREERLRTDWFTFRDPLRRQVPDYYEALADRIQGCVIAFCEAVKRGTNGESLAGSHLGAFMDNGFHGYLYHQTCINKVARALEHPAVDTFTSPASYENRDPGGDATSMMPAGSYGLHGKLIFQDQDTRTCIVPDEYRENFTLGRIAADMRETEGVLKRDFSHMLIRGYGLWWHAMVPGMYDHPDISACIAKLSTIAKKSLHFPRGTADGIAMVVDEESNFHQQCANRLIFPMLYYQRQRYWSRAGTAWDVFLHNDLTHPRMPDAQLYFFLNTFYLTDGEIEAIEQKVKRGGATVIWTYAPGIQSAAGLSLERVERLTGFRLRSADVEALPRITFTNFEHPYVGYRRPVAGDQYMHGAMQPIFFGTGPMGNDERERVVGPIIYVDDPDAVVLGELDSLQKPGFCVKQMEDWTSVFVAAPMLNQYVLRNIAAAAGVHIYSDSDDVILPGRSFIMIHARKAGTKTIRLPGPSNVFECYDEREVGRNITEIRDTLDRHDTRLYFVGDIDAYHKAPA